MQHGTTPQAREERLWQAMCESVRALVPRCHTHSTVAGWYEGYKDHPAYKSRWLTRFIQPGRECPNLKLLEIAFAKILLRLLGEGSHVPMEIRGELSDALNAFVLSEHGIDSRHFLRIPRLHDDLYRFRHPKHAFELRPFVVFSDGERDIVGAHPGLEGDRRKRLYEAWFESGAGRHRFMLLEKANPETGGWECVAVSIVLGLPSDVATKFVEGAYETVRHLGSDFTSDFHGRMTPRGEAVDCILVDTFIVSKQPNAGARRINHQGWGTALLFRHIATFVAQDGDVRLFVEPAEERLKILCDAYAFEQKTKTLWAKDCHRSGARDQFSDSLWKNVQELKARFPFIEGEAPQG